MKYFDKIGTLVNRFAGGGINVPLLRRIIGGLGVALPLIVLFWGLAINGAVQDSISDYYAFRTRDAFVGILFVIGWVLFAYRGYQKVDNVAGNLACVFSLGVALFSNTDGGWISKVHFICAGCLFALFAFFSIFLFTKSKNTPEKFWDAIKWVLKGKATKEDGYMKPRKITRNKIYIAGGIIILAMLLLLGLYMLLWQHTVLDNAKPELILEWIMVWAFSASWLIKGEYLLKDKKHSQSVTNQPIASV